MGRRTRRGEAGNATTGDGLELLVGIVISWAPMTLIGLGWAGLSISDYYPEHRQPSPGTTSLPSSVLDSSSLSSTPLFSTSPSSVPHGTAQAAAATDLGRQISSKEEKEAIDELIRHEILQEGIHLR